MSTPLVRFGVLHASYFFYFIFFLYHPPLSFIRIYTPERFLFLFRFRSISLDDQLNQVNALLPDPTVFALRPPLYFLCFSLYIRDLSLFYFILSDIVPRHCLKLWACRAFGPVKQLKICVTLIRPPPCSSIFQRHQSYASLMLCTDEGQQIKTIKSVNIRVSGKNLR